MIVGPQRLVNLGFIADLDTSTMIAPPEWMEGTPGARSFGAMEIWFVAQNRSGNMPRQIRHLIERTGSRYAIASKLGIPLVWAFPYDEVEASGIQLREER